MPDNEMEALDKTPGKIVDTNRAGKLEKIIRSISTNAMRVSMVVLFGLMFLGAGDVIGRYFFNRPITGGQEIGGLLLVIIVFFAVAHTQLSKGHIVIEILHERFSPKLKAQSGIGVNIILIGIFAIMAWQGLVTATDYMEDGRKFVETTWIQWPFQLIIPIGSTIMCLALILEILQYISQLRKEG